MWPIFALFLLVRCAWCDINQCDPFTGSSGTTDCIRLYSYNNEYLWATCPLCRPLGKGLLVLSMVEVFHKNSGPVKTAFSCTPGRKLTSHLPQSCSSPSGDSCNWYSDCFEKDYSCQDTTNAYAVRYAGRFARCMKGKEPCSMRKDKNGWMLPVGVCKLIWCRWCVRGATQLVTRYGNGPSQLIFHAF